MESRNKLNAASSLINLALVPFAALLLKDLCGLKKRIEEMADASRRKAGSDICDMEAIRSESSEYDASDMLRTPEMAMAPNDLYLHKGIFEAADVVRCLKVLLEMEFRSRHLSLMEKEVAKCMLFNDTNEDIGRKLFISVSMVKYHAHNIYKKAECEDRRMFVKTIRHGIANSKHCWRTRVDLERDLERLKIR